MHGARRPIPLRRLLTRLALLLAITCLLPESRAGFGTPDPTPTAGTSAPAPTSVPMPSVSAARQANLVAVITIDGPIDGITARSFRRRLDEAAALKADAVVVELNTPGGELGAVLEISNALKQSPIRNTVAWVRPMAYSGGAIIALACREIVVSDGSSFGDAKVINIDRSSFTRQIRGMNNDERQKLLPPLLADLVDSARRHNRAAGAYQWDELLVQAIVATDAELWWVRDNQTGICFAVDRAEFERLFPDSPVLQPMLATASVGSNETATRSPGKPIRRNAPPSPPAETETPAPEGSDTPPESAPFTPAAPSLSDIRAKTEQALDLAGATPSLRPRTGENTNGRYTLLAKICNGDGAIVLHDPEMVYFQLASNFTTGTDGTKAINPVNTDQDFQKFAGASTITRLDESWSEVLARFMSASWIRGLLITVFLICVFIEMFSPGVTLPATIAILCLVALFLPPIIVGMAMWWQLAAILFGVVLLAAEIFILPGFGIAGVLGLLCLLIGMIGVFIPGSSGIGATAAEFRSGLATGVTTMLLAGATTWIALFFIYRNLGSIPALRHLVLQNPDFESGGEGSMLAAMSTGEIAVGDSGTTVTPLRPAGKAEINGRLYDVIAEFGMVELGKPVRVASVTPFRIGVEAVRNG